MSIRKLNALMEHKLELERMMNVCEKLLKANKINVDGPMVVNTELNECVDLEFVRLGHLTYTKIKNLQEKVRKAFETELDKMLFLGGVPNPSEEL